MTKMMERSNLQTVEYTTCNDEDDEKEQFDQRKRLPLDFKDGERSWEFLLKGLFDLPHSFFSSLGSGITPSPQ